MGPQNGIGEIEPTGQPHYKLLQTGCCCRHRPSPTVVIKSMKTPKTPLCIALAVALGATSPAFAEHGSYYRHDAYHHDAPPRIFPHPPAPRYYAPPPSPVYHQPAPPRHDRHHHGGDWVAPVALLAIAGLAAVTLSRPARVAPAPVMAPPPPLQPVTSNFWHYCPTSGQYYPNARYCDTAWQLVPAN